jgi:hypothetical protein
LTQIQGLFALGFQSPTAFWRSLAQKCVLASGRMKTDRTTRKETPTALELNGKLILRGIKALRAGKMKVTVAGYLRLQRGIPLQSVRATPPLWIEK